MKILFTGTTGLNNLLDPVRLPYNQDSGIADLSEAINVSIDDTGGVSRRSGQTLLSESVSHSLFCANGDCFVAQDRLDDAALYQVGTDYSLSGIRSGLMKGARISFVQIGSKTYYSNGFQNGFIENGISFPWPVYVPHVGAKTVRAFYDAPVGHHLAYFQSSIWIAEEKVIWVSEPNAFNKFDLARKFFQFGSNVIMIKPVAGGVWISDEEKIGFITAEERFVDMQYIKKASVPAHEWSVNIELVDLSDTKYQIAGLCAVWSSNEGLCIGTPEGQLIVPTKDKLSYPVGSRGATLVDKNNVINTIY